MLRSLECRSSLPNEIGETSVHLWKVHLDLSAGWSDHFQILSPEEKERAARFRFVRDRRRYQLSHGALRTILGAYAGIEPREVRFRSSETGKPELAVASGAPAITFNMSHSGDMMMLAVARRCIGVDVELIDPKIDVFQIAQKHFAAREYEEILAAPAEYRLEAFFSQWTRKEAYLKAVGCGIVHGLPHFPPIAEDSVWLSKPGVSVRSQHIGHWTLFSLKPWDGYAAAAVVEGRPREIDLFEADQDCNETVKASDVAQLKIGCTRNSTSEKTADSSGVKERFI